MLNPNTPSYLRSYRQMVTAGVLMLFFGVLAIILCQCASWDLRNYHWYNAYAFIHNRLSWDIAPAQLQTYFNPLLDVINYFVMTHVHSVAGVEFIFGALTGLLAFLVLKIAVLFFHSQARILQSFYIIVALLIGVTGTATISQLGVAFTETEVAIFIMLALYFSLIAIVKEKMAQRYKYIALAGFILGLGVGLKLTAAVYLIGLGVAFCLYTQPKLSDLRLLFVFGIVFVIGFICTDGFWMLKLYTNFKSPTFPFFNQIMHSSYANSVDYKDSRFLPKSFLQYLFYPYFWTQKNALVSENPFRDYRLAVLMTITILWTIKSFFQKKSPLVKASAQWNFFLLFIVSSYVIWLLLFSIYRYIIPIELVSGIAIVYLCRALFKSPKIHILIISSLTAIILATTKYPHYGYMYQVQVNPPKLPPNALIIMLGYLPQAYVIPFFPIDTQFVSPFNSFMDPANRNLLQKKADTLILEYKGPMFVIKTVKDEPEKILSRYKLVPMQKCQDIYSSFDGKLFSICRLRRL